MIRRIGAPGGGREQGGLPEWQQISSFESTFHLVRVQVGDARLVEMLQAAMVFCSHRARDASTLHTTALQSAPVSCPGNLVG